MSVIPASTLRKCSACDADVERNHCHKNRYGEYICRACQTSGVKVTRRRRLSIWLKKVERVVWRAAFIAGSGALAAWILWQSFERIDSPSSPPPQAAVLQLMNKA